MNAALPAIRPEIGLREDLRRYEALEDAADMERERIQSIADALEADLLTPTADVALIHMLISCLTDDGYRALIQAILTPSEAAAKTVRDELRENIYQEAKEKA